MEEVLEGKEKRLRRRNPTNLRKRKTKREDETDDRSKLSHLATHDGGGGGGGWNGMEWKSKEMLAAAAAGICVPREKSRGICKKVHFDRRRR